MAYDVPLGTRLTAPVDDRLRVLVTIAGRPLCHVLDALLDQVLPTDDELADLVREGCRRGLAAALDVCPRPGQRRVVTANGRAGSKPGQDAGPRRGRRAQLSPASRAGGPRSRSRRGPPGTG
jgi:hypothetical protein